MMCYRDMIFCVAKCANTTCPLKFTDKVQQDAQKWWGNENAPVALGDLSEGCKYYKPTNKPVEP